MIEYLKKEYARTHFPNFSVTALKNMGLFDVGLANELQAANRVENRPGMGIRLLILIIGDDGFWEQ